MSSYGKLKESGKKIGGKRPTAGTEIPGHE